MVACNLDHYLVSTMSNSVMLAIQKRFDSKWCPEPFSGCWLWTGSDNGDGCGRLNINRRFRGAHQVSWELHNGNIPVGMCILHKCDVRCCVNPRHLFLGSKSANTIDAVTKGRWTQNRGEKSCHATLSDEQVLRIRLSKDTGRKLAKEMQVSEYAVSRARNRKTWKHL